ncbi:MAG: hypothetical protein IT514_13125 [Burkholderiales bacterium]|nr:hypothetical protein [Burkholderiales bacterium]
MNFTDVLRAAGAPVADDYRAGLAAAKTAHARQILCIDPRRLEGSIDLDACFAAVPEHRRENRWDYGIGYRTTAGEHRAVWVEVHPASTSQVRVVLAKLKWLQRRINAWGVPAQRLSSQRDASHRPYVWLATPGRISIYANTRTARCLRSAGLDLPSRTCRIP